MTEERHEVTHTPRRPHSRPGGVVPSTTRPEEDHPMRKAITRPPKHTAITKDSRLVRKGGRA